MLFVNIATTIGEKKSEGDRNLTRCQIQAIGLAARINTAYGINQQLNLKTCDQMLKMVIPLPNPFGGLAVAT